VTPDFSFQQLLASSFFANLTPDLMEKVLQACSEISLAQGDVLNHRGDNGLACFGVYKGQLKAFSHEISGKEMTLAVLTPGMWFGEISLIDQLPRTHGTIATEDSVLLKMPKEAFDLAVAEQPAIAMDISRHLCHRLRLAFTAVEESTLLTLDQRLAKKLLYLAPLQAGLTVTPSCIQVSQQEIAYMLGVSRQSISKWLTAWAKDSIIALSYNGFTIQNREKLQVISGQETVPM